MQTDQRQLEYLWNYKESLRTCLSCKDYAGAAALEKTMLEDAVATGCDIAAMREAMSAAYWDIKNEKPPSMKRKYGELWSAAQGKRTGRLFQRTHQAAQPDDTGDTSDPSDRTARKTGEEVNHAKRPPVTPRTTQPGRYAKRVIRFGHPGWRTVTSEPGR